MDEGEWELTGAQEMETYSAMEKEQIAICSIGTSRKYFYFDIETIPDMSRIDLFNSLGISAPAEVKQMPYEHCAPLEEAVGWTIPKLKEYVHDAMPCDLWLRELLTVENAKEKPRDGVAKEVAFGLSVIDQYEADITKYLKKLSTTPELCKVAALGFAIDRGVIHTGVAGVDDDTEESLLLQFWEMAANFEPIVGFNICAFDLPVIIARSVMLGIAGRKYLDLRPWSQNCLDLMLKRFGGPARAIDLKTWAMLHGIVPQSDLDGSRVWGVYQQNPAALHDYVASDVSLTRQMHRLYLNGFW